MKRAILIALCTGVVFSSAAALDIAGGRQPTGPHALGDPIHVARVREAAREEQRGEIHARYLAQRQQCAELRGFQREKCLVRAHANKGRALLAIAAPYETRF